jgi:hypothetical protein
LIASAVLIITACDDQQDEFCGVYPERCRNWGRAQAGCTPGAASNKDSKAVGSCHANGQLEEGVLK